MLLQGRHLRALWGWQWRDGRDWRPPTPGLSRNSRGPGCNPETEELHPVHSTLRGRCCGSEPHHAEPSRLGGHAQFSPADGPKWTEWWRGAGKNFLHLRALMSHFISCFQNLKTLYAQKEVSCLENKNWIFLKPLGKKVTNEQCSL